MRFALEGGNGGEFHNFKAKDAFFEIISGHDKLTDVKLHNPLTFKEKIAIFSEHTLGVHSSELSAFL